MARIAVHPNGCTASCPREGPLDYEPAKRGACKGWTPQVTGRLRRFLYSVDGAQLDGEGVATSLTVRDLPPTAKDWTRTRERFIDRLQYEGLVRGQWLTEWQKRGVPHLHGALYFPEGFHEAHKAVRRHWLEVAGPWGAGEGGQSVQPIWGLAGWLEYQAKHSARGVRHYQRANVPEAWRGNTGRLWGSVGTWPLREELVNVDMATFHRFRRLLRGYLLSEARARGEFRRVRFLRGMLSDPDRPRCIVRAMGEFVPESVSRDLLLAAAEGDLGVFDEPALEP